MHLYVEMGELEVYVSFECTARLHFRAPQRPVEHRCRLTLGGSRQHHQTPGPGGSSTCVLTVEGEACQRRTFRVTKDNVAKVAARLGEGSMTVVFRHGCCDSLVVKEVVNRGALTLCHKIISGIWMGVEGVTSKGVAERFGSPPTSGHGAAGSEAGQSLSARGRRKIELTLNKRYGDTRGSRMLEAAQNKSATAFSFYKTDSPTVESFLPQTPPTSSPYFQRPARRNLTLELSSERRDGGESSGKPLTPQQQGSGGQGHLGPRKAAVFARKRLPLGDICEQTASAGPELKDYLTMDEPSSREGFANLGNTCYMNAVLQVLLGLEPFAEDLLNQQLVKGIDPQSLCRMMFLLLKSKRAKDSYDSQRILLKKIKSVIESSRPKFSGHRQQDAHELLTQCLDQLKDDSKHIKMAGSEDRQSQCSVCPVIRNFECEMCRSITCKSCGKVSEVSEVIYDFALQLPKSVISRANKQSTLQDLLDRFFNCEEVEYKCPVCSCSTATMSCRLARLPRVMIIFLKRYGYNSNLSRNSKRVDFIRIPRFITVGHLCSESTAPPCEYQGPWPSSSGNDKENLPSSEGPLSVESFPTGPGPHSSAVGSRTISSSGSSGRILGKRRGSESFVQEFATHGNRDVVKKQRVDQVSVSTSSCVQPSTAGPVVASGSVAQARTSLADGGPCSTNGPRLSGCGVVTSGDASTTAVSSGRDGSADNSANTDVKYSQSSVGRDIAAEFDSLFSPEILLQLDNDPQLTLGSSNAPPETTTPTVGSSAGLTDSTTSVPANTHGGSGDSRTTTQLPAGVSSETSTGGVASSVTEHPLPSAPHKKAAADVESLMLGLFGGVSSEEESRCGGSGGTREEVPVEGHEVGGEERKLEEEEEDLGLQRAMEESMREQHSSDVALLQRMGLSEEEQLKLALELSMQEQCVEECPMDQQPSSRDCAEPEAPTPDAQKPETYKLMGVVNHIGKASSGGHYISDVCSAREGVWRSYNDSYVSESREEDIRQKRQGTGYIFFYMHKSVLGSITGSIKRTT